MNKKEAYWAGMYAKAAGFPLSQMPSFSDVEIEDAYKKGFACKVSGSDKERIREQATHSLKSRNSDNV